jgi:hypothetical protein
VHCPNFRPLRATKHCSCGTFPESAQVVTLSKILPFLNWHLVAVTFLMAHASSTTACRRWLLCANQRISSCRVGQA